MEHLHEFESFGINEYDEYYDPDKLYLKSAIVQRLRKGTGYIRNYIAKLPSIPCKDQNGNDQICTKIPEVVHRYLFGRF